MGRNQELDGLLRMDEKKYVDWNAAYRREQRSIVLGEFHSEIPGYGTAPSRPEFR